MRLDRFLVDKKLVKSRSKAQNLISLGLVKVNGNVILKSAYEVKPDNDVEITQGTFVSRGGYKLVNFLSRFDFDFNQKLVLDIGCSTGGFSDFFLKNNAKVFGVDVNDVLDKSIKENENFTFVKANILDLNDFEDKLKKHNVSKFDFISVDVSNLRLEYFIFDLKEFMHEKSYLIVLFKPAYVLNKSVDENLALSLAEELKGKLAKSFEVVSFELSELKGKVKNQGSSEVFFLLKLKK